jgi:CheY-like chemotaxis protein
LVRQLLGFARRQVVQPRVLNLNDHVINTEKMLCRLIGEDIELVCRLELELGLVKADAGQIEQVLVNLSVNARDAMPGGGKLTIATANVDLDAGSIPKSVGLIPGPYVKISVGDTGAGMSEEVRSHLFEPFFTTKGVGEGTGLGLATCYGIVKQSGGEIRVQSAPEQGTTFEIYLPRVGGTAPPVAEAGEPEELSKGMETVLLVEDEPAVRSLAALALRRQGYTVLEAANGQEALQVAQDRNGNEIDLLLTDVVMPRMGGRELADRLCPLMPRMRVLLSSGFPDQAPAPGEKWDAGIAFMPKPFTPAVLAEKVREVLDTPSPGA